MLINIFFTNIFMLMNMKEDGIEVQHFRDKSLFISSEFNIPVKYNYPVDNAINFRTAGPRTVYCRMQCRHV